MRTGVPFGRVSQIAGSCGYIRALRMNLAPNTLKLTPHCCNDAPVQEVNKI